MKSRLLDELAWFAYCALFQLEKINVEVNMAYGRFEAQLGRKVFMFTRKMVLPVCWIFFVLIFGLVGGCSKSSDEKAKSDASPKSSSSQHELSSAMTKAKNIFQIRCVTCHGQTGKGDGPAGRALKPRPRSFGDPTWQKEVSDAHIEKIIEQGGAAVGMSPLMPPNPDLVNQPDVVKALRLIVRDFGPKS